MPKKFTSIHSTYLKKNIKKKVLTRYIYPNITDPGESRGLPISRSYEKDRDAFASAVFGRFCRLVLRGEYKLLRRSRLAPSPGRNLQPALEPAKPLRMVGDQRRFGHRRR